MTISNDLWQSNQDLVQASLEHPFVQGIAKGTLERDRFAFYVGQDAFFLEAFARAYSLAAAKAPDWDSFNQFHQLADGVLKELCLHASYATQWGVNLHEIEPSRATRRYTDFLLATAWGNGAALTAVAMSPCMRLYAYLGQSLAQHEMGEHQYSDWIRTYSDPRFEQLAQTLETFVNCHAIASPQTRSTYRYALFCERDFFTAAWDYKQQMM